MNSDQQYTFPSIGDVKSGDEVFIAPYGWLEVTDRTFNDVKKLESLCRRKAEPQLVARITANKFSELAERLSKEGLEIPKAGAGLLDDLRKWSRPDPVDLGIETLKKERHELKQKVESLLGINDAIAAERDRAISELAKKNVTERICVINGVEVRRAEIEEMMPKISGYIFSIAHNHGFKYKSGPIFPLQGMLEVLQSMEAKLPATEKERDRILAAIREVQALMPDTLTEEPWPLQLEWLRRRITENEWEEKYHGVCGLISKAHEIVTGKVDDGPTDEQFLGPIRAMVEYLEMSKVTIHDTKVLLEQAGENGKIAEAIEKVIKERDKLKTMQIVNITDTKPPEPVAPAACPLTIEHIHLLQKDGVCHVDTGEMLERGFNLAQLRLWLGQHPGYGITHCDSANNSVTIEFAIKEASVPWPLTQDQLETFEKEYTVEFDRSTVSEVQIKLWLKQHPDCGIERHIGKGMMFLRRF
jgi:hypothetical protein